MREYAVSVCEGVVSKGIKDPKLNNNMGVLFKRENMFDKAMESYGNALTDSNSTQGKFVSQDFFPLYNMAVSLTSMK